MLKNVSAIILKHKPLICPIIFGIVLVLIGLFMKIPGSALTTYSSLDGKSTDSDYYISDRYSAIDEYVGGDAYNYIIGASLVAGKITGIITAKTICLVVGFGFICVGITLILLKEEKSKTETKNANEIQNNIINES